MESDKKIGTELTPKNPDSIGLLDKEAEFLFAFKKTEKLGSAIYMVTSLFPDNEPMKWNLRKQVSDLLSFIITYKDISESKHQDFVHTAKNKVLEIVSLLEISWRGGLISNMNFSILKQEFTNLIDSVSSSKDSEISVFPKSFFDVKEVKTAKNYPVYSQEIKDKNVHAPGKSDLKKSERQNTILALIKKKKELTIKDLSEVIKDCSEKTIQRELISLISMGVLKRTGERRWSKYSLKNE
jgi:hypothetical protein